MRVLPLCAVAGALQQRPQWGRRRQGKAAAAASGWCGWRLTRCGRWHGLIRNLTGTVRRRQGAGGTGARGLRRPAPRQGPADGPMQHGRKQKDRKSLIGAQGEGGFWAASGAIRQPSRLAARLVPLFDLQAPCSSHSDSASPPRRWASGQGGPRCSQAPRAAPRCPQVGLAFTIPVASAPCTLLQLPPPPPPAAAAAPCKPSCRHRLAMSFPTPSCPSLSPLAGAGELRRWPALLPCLAGATRMTRRSRRRRSSSGAAAAGSSQRHGRCPIVPACPKQLQQASSAYRALLFDAAGGSSRKRCSSMHWACTGQLCANCVLAGLQCRPCRRKQQEVLQRRRSNSWQAEVKERRAEVSRYMQDPAYKKQVRSTAEAGCIADELGCRSVDGMQLCTATRYR